jgi:hypothetical protein
MRFVDAAASMRILQRVTPHFGRNDVFDPDRFLLVNATFPMKNGHSGARILATELV